MGNFSPNFIRIIFPNSINAGLMGLFIMASELLSLLRMNKILLCTHDPILVKSLYGVLRDKGYGVEIADHPAFAVQMVLKGDYRALIIDSGPFGLSAAEAVQIIKSLLPEMPVVVLGQAALAYDTLSVKKPFDLEELQRTIRDIQDSCCTSANSSERGNS